MPGPNGLAARGSRGARHAGAGSSSYASSHHPVGSEGTGPRLALRTSGGARERQHNHHLKSAIWRARCHRHSVVQRAKGNGGTYFHFFCIGFLLYRTPEGHLQSPYLSVRQVKRQIVRHHATIHRADESQQQLRRQLADTLVYELSSMDALRKRFTAHLEEPSPKEGRYLGLVGDPG